MLTMEYFSNTQSSFLANTTLFGTAWTTDEDYFYYYENVFHFLTLFSMVSYSITCLLGVVGNGIVIWVGTVKMSRTVTVIWFLNLAIADFIFDIFLPLQIVPLTMNWRWPFGSLLCKISHMVLALNMFSSILFLVIISVDRCVSVLCPVCSRNHRTPKLAWRVTLVLWALSVTFSAPYPAFYDTTSPLNSKDSLPFCFLSYAVEVADDSWEWSETMYMRHRIMVIMRFISMFLAPFIIIIICYGSIALKIRNRRHLATSSKPYKVIIGIIVLFFVCWFPFHAIPLLEAYSLSNWLFPFTEACLTVAQGLAYLNTCLNPILYVFMGRDFKDTCGRSFLSVFQRAFSEEATTVTTDSRSLPKTSTTVESYLL